MNWAKGYRNPTYIVKGAKVFIAFVHEGQLTGLPCRVEEACGDAGRVINEKYGVDKWIMLEDMGVKDDDPLGRYPSQIALEMERIFRENEAPI